MPENLLPDFNLADGRGHMLNKDYAAAGRLNNQFFCWKDTFGFNIHPTIELPASPTIADVATGTAIWPIHVAREHPTAKIEGLDVNLSSAPHKTFLPSNVSLRTWNLFDEVPEDLKEKYDFIHCRLLVLVIENQDPRHLLKNLKKMLKPNGYLQWDELDYLHTVVQASDSLATPALDKFKDMVKSNGRPSWINRLDEFATGEGFEGAKIYEYEDKTDMLGPQMLNYLITMDEFGTRLQSKNLHEEGTRIKNLCQETYSETQNGGILKMPKLVFVARKTHDLSNSKTVNSTSSPYYREHIGPRLKPVIEQAYLKWTGLSGEALNARLYSVRERAWAVAPYPCVGQWMFLLPSISVYPQYPAILARAQQKGVKILDLACCFGQDLRLLAADNVATENMYASDIVGELWNLGYELFGDEEKMKAKFIQADIFDDNSPLQEFKGKMDIIFACQFIHLFNWDRQIIAMKKIVEFTTGPGAMVVGYQRAREKSSSKAMSWGQMYIHDPDTFQEIWRRVEQETSTKWNVDAVLVDLKEWGMEKEDFAWMDQYPMGINFVATRLE